MAFFEALALFLSVPGAWAFTLYGGSNVRGWQTNQLTIQGNFSNCPISRSTFDSAINSAIDLWNTVPTSGLTLVRGDDSTVTPAEAKAGSLPSNPVVLCDNHISSTLGGNTNTNDLPAVTQDAASDGVHISSAYTLLNAQSGQAANISNLSSSLVTIIIAHELGHALGLGHTADSHSLMYFDATLKQTLSLSQDDMDGVTFLYPRQEILGNKVLGCGTLNKDSSEAGGPPDSRSAEVAGLALFCSLAVWLLRKTSRIKEAL